MATVAENDSTVARLGRFAQVGVVNTVIDLVLYGLLVTWGAHFLVANFVSTTAGMTFGFFAHRSYSFRSESRVRDTVLPFVAVTVTGLWLVHPLVIWLSVRALDDVLDPSALTQTWIPKMCAIGVGLVWSYTCYHFVVFARPTPPDGRP